MFELAPRIDAATKEDQLEALARDKHVVGTFHAMHNATEIPYRWTAAILADTTGIAETEIAALLARLSVPFGSQPEFRTPFDVNIARAHPLVDLDEGNYLAPLPWTIAHNVHTIMQAIARDDPAVAKRYQRHRSTGTALLVHDGLAGVFGTDLTHSSQHFVGARRPGEIDTLVEGARVIIAEAKSQALTDPARRGHRPRIERIADEAIEKALSQTQRAATHILSEGGRSFAASEGGTLVERLPADVEERLEIVVTLERMDPLATHSLKLANRERPAWVTNVADFLMVLDVLDDPATLLDYIEVRSLVASLGVEVIMESDALGGYLHDRLTSITDHARRADNHTTVMLGYGSAAINGYFTTIEMGVEYEKPTRGIPSAALRALPRLTSGPPSGAL